MIKYGKGKVQDVKVLTEDTEIKHGTKLASVRVFEPERPDVKSTKK